MPGKKKQTTVSEEKLRLYDRLIATLEGVDTKANLGVASSAVNGNIFPMISKRGRGRYPAAESRRLARKATPDSRPWSL